MYLVYLKFRHHDLTCLKGPKGQGGHFSGEPPFRRCFRFGKPTTWEEALLEGIGGQNHTWFGLKEQPLFAYPRFAGE